MRYNPPVMKIPEKDTKNEAKRIDELSAPANNIPEYIKQRYSRLAELYYHASLFLLRQPQIDTSPFVKELFKKSLEICSLPLMMCVTNADIFTDTTIDIGREINKAVESAIKTSAILMEYENEQFKELTLIGNYIMRALIQNFLYTPPQPK